MRLLSWGFQIPPPPQPPTPNDLNGDKFLPDSLCCCGDICYTPYVTDLFQDASKCSEYESLNEKKICEVWFAPDMNDSEGGLIQNLTYKITADCECNN